jgi:hypothetical protein
MVVPLPVFYFALWFEILSANIAGGLWFLSLMVGIIINVFLWNTKPKSLKAKSPKLDHDTGRTLPSAPDVSNTPA